MTLCQRLLKQEGTARRIESMQQSSATPSLHLGFWGLRKIVIYMLSILLAVPSCFNSFWHSAIPTSYFIFNDFYICFTHFSKTVETRRHCEEDREHATIFRNPLPTSWFLGVAEDCCMLSILLTVPSCFNSFWHGAIPTSYFDFYTNL